MVIRLACSREIPPCLRLTPSASSSSLPAAADEPKPASPSSSSSMPSSSRIEPPRPTPKAPLLDESLMAP